MQRWDRHVEGWQLAVVAVGVALGGAVLALPRPVIPREIPLPRIDRSEELRAEAQSRDLVAEAGSHALPFAVRAAGEAFRRFGASEPSSNSGDAVFLGTAFGARIADARKRYGDRPLLELRAAQADLFVRAVHDWQKSGNDRELVELGGSFLSRARRSDWLGSGRELLLETDALSTMFAVRWTKLAGLLETFPFSPSLNEWRIYFRALLVHPEVELDSGPASEARTLTKYVAALSKRDPDYPSLLARGILQHRMGDYAAAEELFVAFLERSPTGPWRLRAQNYVLAARLRRPAS